MSANRQNGQATELSLFETNDLRTFDDAFPDFQTPEEIGSFSLDINREFENSKKYMKYFVKPPDPSRVNFDLRKGYDTMIKNKKKNEFHILRWIVENLEKFPLKRREDTKGQNGGASGQDRPMKDHGKSISAFSQQHSDEQNQSDQEVNGVQMKLSKMKVSNEDGSETSVPCDITPDRKTRNLDTDFVCRRGLLAKIMRTPYEKKEDWLIAVTLYNGTYYMDDIETEQRKKDEAKWNGREMCCWGWKFEQYLTADSKDGVPDPDAQYNNCEAFYTVVEAQLNNHSLVFSGEVDALNVEEEKGSYYVEFKTNSEITRPKHENKFKRFKLMKWWAQSYIMGVQEIVCGFRGGNGIVHRLEFYNTQELPSLAAESLQNPWKPNVCFNFLDQLLSSIKSNIKTDDHKIVHILSWSPRQPVRCSQPLVDSEHNFLPDWYTEAVK